MKPLKKNFDFKGLFFFIISFGCLVLLLYILYHEIVTLKQNLAEQEQKIEVKEKGMDDNKQNVIQNLHTSIKKEVKTQIQEQKEERKIILKVGTFKNKKNVNKIVSILKKEKWNYKIIGKGPYKVYVFAKSEKEKEKIISLLKGKNIKPIEVRNIES